MAMRRSRRRGRMRRRRSGRAGTRCWRNSALLARDRVRQLALRHRRPPLDPGLPGALVELLLGVAAHVDAAVRALGRVAGLRAPLGGLGVRRALAVLRLPVVADLLERVLDRRPRRLMGAGLGVVGLLGAVERLGIGALGLGG